MAEAAAAGTVFAMTQRREVEAAEKFRKAVPWVEGLRFTNTGTEATMHAIRLARGFTGRDTILKFEGQYHGVHDYVMFSTAGSPPTSARVALPAGPLAVVLGHPRDDPLPHPGAAVQRSRSCWSGCSATRATGSPAVIVEPMLGNAFGIMPKDGYLARIRGASATSTGRC